MENSSSSAGSERARLPDDVNPEVGTQYMAAAQVSVLPENLAEPRAGALFFGNAPKELRRRAEVGTLVWCSGSTLAGRLQRLEDAVQRGEASLEEAAELRGRLTALASQKDLRLPETEIEFALGELGVLEEENGVLTLEEKERLDRDGFLNLGRLLGEQELAEIRRRVDAQVAKEGGAAGLFRPGVEGVGDGQFPGVARVAGTVVKLNDDGLFDVFFTHPRLLAAVRHVLGTRFKMSASNYHCPLPGYGHQMLHADWPFGVPEGQYEVCNAIWLLDEFTEENGPTRVVPGSHRSGHYPSEVLEDPNAPHPEEVYLTGEKGSCIFCNSHLWHGGTQNRSTKLRRSLHSYFTKSLNPLQSDPMVFLKPELYSRLGRAKRAILDVVPPDEATKDHMEAKL